MYDFIDVGASKGGSVLFAQRNFGSNGYGIDIDHNKVAIAKKRGLDVRKQDIFQVQDKAKWVTIMHTLEHLPDMDYCKRLIKKATDIGENVYITFPSFSHDDYLMEWNLRMFWSRWKGHTLHLSKMQLYHILEDIGKPFSVYHWGEIHHSKDDCIVPLDAPVDGFNYKAEMGKKQSVEFEQPVYKEVRAIIGDVNRVIK